MKKEFRALVSLNLSLILILNCISPAAIAAQPEGEKRPVETVEYLTPDEASDPVEIPDALASSNAVVASGYCGGEGDGTNLTWELTEDGTLTISGSGAMADWETGTAPWYNYRDSFTSVVIGDSVITIGSYAFYNCQNLTSVTIPDSVTSIGGYAFAWCGKLASVTLGNSVATIGNDAFCNCRNLTSVTIPDSVTSIGNYAFCVCNNLTGIWVDKSNEFYSNDESGVLFSKDKTALIQAPGGLCGAYAIPDSVTTIGEWAFCSCHNLTSVTIPDSVTSIGDLAFYACDSLTGIWVDESNEFYSSDESGVLFDKEKTKLTQAHGGICGAYTIPDSVTTIGEWAFCSCHNLTSVTIPDSVTTIGNHAFYDCNNLTSVTIPNSVTSIGEEAFRSCRNLASVTIGNSVTTIGNTAFSGCSNLATIRFEGDAPTFNREVFYEVSATAYYPAGNETWTDEVMQDYGGDITWVAYEPGPAVIASGTCGGEGDGTNLNWKLTEDGVLTISGEGAMADWSKWFASPWSEFCQDDIKTIVIDAGVTTIGQWAFYDCYNLTSVTIPNSVTTIGHYAFLLCTNLASVMIPGSVTDIGVQAFDSCVRLAAFAVEESNANYSVDGAGVLFNKDKTTLIRAPGAISGTYAIPESVTIVSAGAFDSCGGLTVITIPDSVISIGESAFEGCKSLTEVTIPDSVTAIGDYAFYYCTALTEVTIGDSVTTIGDYAFRTCASLTEVTIPDSVTTIGNCAFGDCDSLTGIRFEGDAPVFGSDAFYVVTATAYYPANNDTWTDEVKQSCGGDIAWVAYETGPAVIASGTCGGEGDGTNLTWELTADGVLTISGEGAMADWEYPDYSPWDSYCGKITSVVIENGVTTIGNDAFGQCYVLTEVAIPNSVTVIGGSAFYDSGLVTVAIPSSVTHIGDYAFGWCSDLTAITVDPNNPNYSSDSSGVLFDKNKTTLIQAPGAISGTYTIPASVTTIGNSAFYWSENLTGVVIPDSVTTIGESAFLKCNNLTELCLPSSIITIGDWAFFECGFAELVIPNSVTTIGDVAFGRSALAKVTIPDSVITIGECAFISCGLTEVVIPSSVTFIGTSPFAECWQLTGIWVDEENPCYSSDAFGVLFDKDKTTLIQAPGAIETYTIPDSVTTIGGSAFDFCESLTEVTIPNSVTSIGDRAFYSCDNLTTVTIPDSVTSIGDDAFAHCGLTSVTIPASVVSIGTAAFEGCRNLAGVTIPDSVTTIGDDAFAYCGLASVTIPASVTTIGDYAFRWCNSLTQIRFEGDAPEFGGSDAFEGVTATAYYPAGNKTWTADVKQSCGGKLKWVAYEPGPAVIASGTCGDALTWALDTEGTLTVSGTGAMYDYNDDEPWKSLRDSISAVVIEDGVTGVGNRAFRDCDALEYVEIGNTVTTIGAHAFYHCDSLSGVQLGSAVQIIGTLAFSGNPALANIDIPDSVQIIGDFAFHNNEALDYVSIGSGINVIGDNAFGGCSNLSRVDIGRYELLVTVSDSSFDPHTTVVYKATDPSVLIRGWGVGNGVFANLYSDGRLVISGSGNWTRTVDWPAGITAVEILDGITGMPASAFANCESLERVQLNDAITSIPDFAFYNCVNLRDINLYGINQGIENGAFQYCISLECADIENARNIGYRAFYGSGLTEAALGRDATSIGGEAFGDCDPGFVLRGYRNSFAQTYAKQNGLTFEPLAAYFVWLEGGHPQLASLSCVLDVDAGGIQLSGYSDAYQRYASDNISGIRLIGWNTKADGTGTAYGLDARFVPTEDTTLYARWDLSGVTVTIDGMSFSLESEITTKTWSYGYNPDNHSAVIELHDYRGGSILCPIGTSILAHGDSSVTAERGNAISAMYLEINLVDDANLTVSSGADAPAIAVRAFDLSGTGTMSVATEHAVGVEVRNNFYINRLEGQIVIDAGEMAVSSEGNINIWGNLLDMYISPEATEPAVRYDGGPYLKVKTRGWKLRLNANGGVWADQDGEEKPIESRLNESVDLSDYSDLLSREGYVHTGWMDENDKVEYKPNAVVASSANLVINGVMVSSPNLALYATWTEHTLVVDGAHYDPDAEHSGAGWVYTPAHDDQMAVLELTNYTGGGIYLTADLAVIFTGRNIVRGDAGESGIGSLGKLELTVADETTVIYGGSGDHAVCAGENIVIVNDGKLTLEGGAGGAAICADNWVVIRNDGNLTAVGGSLSNAVCADCINLGGNGKTILVSGGSGLPAVSSNGNGGWANGLKFYGGSNASNAVRCSGPFGYAYVRIQPKSLRVTLNANGGVLPEGVESIQELPQDESNAVVLDEALVSVRDGYAFVGWNTKRDGSGESYLPGESYSFAETTDSVTLYAQWEELEYEIVEEGERLALRLKDGVPADANVMLAVYSESGQMKEIFIGTYGSDRLWHFRTVMPSNSDKIKIFFLGADSAPLRREINPDA